MFVTWISTMGQTFQPIEQRCLCCKACWHIPNKAGTAFPVCQALVQLFILFVVLFEFFSRGFYENELSDNYSRVALGSLVFLVLILNQTQYWRCCRHTGNVRYGWCLSRRRNFYLFVAQSTPVGNEKAKWRSTIQDIPGYFCWLSIAARVQLLKMSARDRIEVARSVNRFCYPHSGNVGHSWCLSSILYLSVGFVIQDEAINAAQSTPQRPITKRTLFQCPLAGS